MGDVENFSNSEKVTVNEEDNNLESKVTSAILKLEEVDKNLFKADYYWKKENRGVYGGQIIGQALVAASETVPDGFNVHSMHSYFLLPGDGVRPVIYHVENMRDGNSFSTRLVKAVQKGRVIFTCMLSFHKHEFSPLTHQYKMPEVPPPDSLASLEELLLESVSKGEIKMDELVQAKSLLSVENMFDLKPVHQDQFKSLLGFYLPTEPAEPKLIIWIKIKGRIGTSQQNLHRCVVGYISDTYLLSSALLAIPREKYGLTMMSSLDHSLWFHSHIRGDEWMLYECESPRIIGSRALMFGRLWNQDGTLAVSVAQEGLIRVTSNL